MPRGEVRFAPVQNKQSKSKETTFARTSQLTKAVFLFIIATFTTVGWFLVQPEPGEPTVDETSRR